MQGGCYAEHYCSSYKHHNPAALQAWTFHRGRGSSKTACMHLSRGGNGSAWADQRDPPITKQAGALTTHTLPPRLVHQRTGSDNNNHFKPQAVPTYTQPGSCCFTHSPGAHVVLPWRVQDQHRKRGVRRGRPQPQLATSEPHAPSTSLLLPLLPSAPSPASRPRRRRRCCCCPSSRHAPRLMPLRHYNDVLIFRVRHAVSVHGRVSGHVQPPHVQVSQLGHAHHRPRPGVWCEGHLPQLQHHQGGEGGKKPRGAALGGLRRSGTQAPRRVATTGVVLQCTTRDCTYGGCMARQVSEHGKSGRNGHAAHQVHGRQAQGSQGGAIGPCVQQLART